MSLFFRIAIPALFIVGLIFGQADRAIAQEGQSLSNKTANPLGGDFILVINQFDFIDQKGSATNSPAAPSDPGLNVYTLQPVISAPLKNVIGPGWSFVFRPTVQYFFDSDLPNTSAPGLFKNVDGWGDTSAFALIGKTIPTTLGGGGVFMFAPGIAGSIPIGDKNFTSDKFMLGPALAVAYIGKPAVLGVVAQHFWDVADDRSGGTAPSVNKTILQVPYYINLTPQLALGATPLWTLDWENDSYEIPLGLGLTYTGSIIDGLPPVKMGFEVSTYVSHNKIYGGDWAIKVFFIPILPTPIRKLFPFLYE